jgi:ribonuclease VapC
MIAVDSSAVIAAAMEEPEGSLFGPALFGKLCLIGWPTVFETRMVLTGKKTAAALAFLDRWLERRNVSCRSFDGSFYRTATAAFTRYGRGMGHPAKLNFGDCMAYATAKVEGLPLLYKGTDFGLTDIRPALR